MSDPTEQATLPTIEDAMSSLTGFDQIAIRQAFKMSFSAIRDEDPLQLLYALVFILKRRDGLNDGQAFQAAQALTITDVQACFADEDLDPASDQGKGE